MLRAVILCVLLSVLAGCATTPVRHSPTEAKLIEANDALDVLVKDTQEFYTDIEAARHDVRLLYQHPGWPEMQEIIEAMDSHGRAEGNGWDEAESAKATEQWSLKWNEPWEEIFSRYLSLVKRCSALEARRITLQSRVLGVQAKYLSAAATEYLKGSYSEGQSINEIVGILNNSAAELDSYTVDSMGLYN